MVKVVVDAKQILSWVLGPDSDRHKQFSDQRQCVRARDVAGLVLHKLTTSERGPRLGLGILAVLVTAASCPSPLNAQAFDPAPANIQPMQAEPTATVRRKRSANPPKPASKEPQTISLVSGQPGSTALDIAYDLSTALSDENLRVTVLLGEGGERNITDVLRTRGIDMGIMTTTDLRQAEQTDATKRVVAIAKLYNTELHVLGQRDIQHVTDLDGRKVNLGEPGSSTQLLARSLLNHLGIRFTETNFGQREAIARMQSGGDIAAALFLSGKPTALYAELSDATNLHFVSVPYDHGLADDFYPASLAHADYPRLISADETVDTIAVASVLIAFDWAKTSERYQRLSNFTRALFNRFDQLRLPGRHPKWSEVNLAAPVPGWRRFKPAQDALEGRGEPSISTNRMMGTPSAPSSGNRAASEQLQKSP
ncbi:TAXI family TRAP transporter solute-binding subunit [Methylobacterium planeticum]|uniref:TAXI family TRAP transporter solute-binding subunit n=1 Tax=Methylobacterium planeticum TaxID=2615211 RepID=A0A6N6MGU4_9HYPH|nr:TAXI family TRAP transporter solute-binding subunit [Methylobacterium planeticum]KAB1070111.1 hypothetical protein F6X51_23835 [Methylobacterium planeticum]